MTARKKTVITLYRSVPFDDTYKHIVQWTSDTELQNFLKPYMAYQVKDASYQNLNETIRWPQKVATYNQLVECNYLMINQDGKNYYCFIAGLNYHNDGMVSISFNIDIWNTYWQRFDLNRQVYIKRSHIVTSLKNSDMYRSLQLADEDLGGDGATYQVAMKPINFFDDDDQIKFLIIQTEPSDVKKPGSKYGVYTQLREYVLAVNWITGIVYQMKDSSGTVINVGSQGQDISTAMMVIAKEHEFIGTSTLIQSVEIRDSIGLKFTKSGNNLTFTDLKAGSYDKDKAGQLMLVKSVPNSAVKMETATLTDCLKAARNSLKASVGDDYNPRLLGSPFMTLKVSNARGTEKDFNMGLRTNVEEPFVLHRWATLWANSKTYYALDNINGLDAKSTAATPRNYLPSLFVDENDSSIPFMTDSYTAYLNAHRNQIANTKVNARIALEQTRESNALNMANLDRTQRTAAASQEYGQNRQMGGLLLGGAAAVLGNTLTGNFAGALGAGLSTLTGGLTQAYNNTTARNQLAMSQATQKYNAEQNAAFANKVGQNNYEMTLRNQAASLKDTRNANDNVVSQGGELAGDFTQNITGKWSWHLFTCNPGYLEVAQQYFLLFGNQLDKIANLNDYFGKHRKVFSYVRTRGADVSGDVPQPAINALNAILDNGVTVWNHKHTDEFKTRNQLDVGNSVVE